MTNSIVSSARKSMFIFGCLISFSLFASAQQTEYEYIKTQFHSDKKTLLMHYLMLTDSQAAKFWPIYNNYEKERGALADNRYANLRTYSEQYKMMTDDQADKMIDNFFSNNEKQEDIQKKYYNQVKKALGGKTAASWVQFEAYIDAAVRYQVLHNIPFLNEK